jgi:hypothetical protein
MTKPKKQEIIGLNCFWFDFGFKSYKKNSNWLFYSSKNQTKPKILIPNLNSRSFV